MFMWWVMNWTRRMDKMDAKMRMLTLLEWERRRSSFLSFHPSQIGLECIFSNKLPCTKFCHEYKYKKSSWLVVQYMLSPHFIFTRFFYSLYFYLLLHSQTYFENAMKCYDMTQCIPTFLWSLHWKKPIFIFIYGFKMSQFICSSYEVNITMIWAIWL